MQKYGNRTLNTRWHLIGNILFAILSMVYCCMAPGEMSVSFCRLVTVTFLVHNIWHYATLDRKNWMGFELFFAIAFFFINFLYPTVIYSLDPDYGVYERSFNMMVISRSTAIAYMGYAWYLLGTTTILHGERPEPCPAAIIIPHRQMNVIFGLAILNFALFMVLGGWGALRSVYADGGDMTEVGIYSYFRVLFTLFSYLLAAFVFLIDGWQKWLYLGYLVICILLLLMTGSRTFALGVMLTLLIGWNNNIRRFRWWEIAIVILLGMITLYAVVVLRSKDGFIEAKGTGSSIGILGVFVDLIINNRNLYVLVDYADTHSFTWFQGFLLDLFNPIPGMAGILQKLTGQPYEMINGGSLPTYLELGADATWGLGTNMIGEIYRSFGYTGTAIYMLLVGHLVKTTYFHASTNVYAYVVYYILCSHAVMWGRAPFLPDLRYITWALLIIYVLFRPLQTSRKKS